mmetsp:Transcript_18478/g.48195  ORF Transcript_18478/g.48195 Transcript_18478/m.48195 type:complete len:264 (+) Transcript_18478:89-880(+)
MFSRGVPLLLAIAGVCNALVPHRIAAARSNALGAFKSNFPPVDGGPESTTDKPAAAATTESDAASDASRAALEASFAVEAAPVADPTAGAALLDALTGKTKGADLGPLIDACEESYDKRSFDEKAILGPWRLKYQLDGKKAQRSQKLLAPDKTGFPADSDFITDDKGRKVFRNVARLSKKRVAVIADVAYEVSEGIPNRLLSDIVAASIQIQVGKRFGWRPLRIPLPLKGLGWLDVTYLDDKLRVTRGNRGGLFVHVRPELDK